MNMPTFRPGDRILYGNRRIPGTFRTTISETHAEITLDGLTEPQTVPRATLSRWGIERTFTLTTRTTRVRVQTRHPRYPGELFDRGTIHRTDTGWQPVTYEHEHLDTVVGDYLDAEQVLLAATAGLDT